MIYKTSERIKCHVRGRIGFASRRIYLSTMLVSIILQSLNNHVQGEALSHNQKTTTSLKFLQRPSSLIQLRYKRDNFVNKEQQQQQQPHTNDYLYDDNYDVLPDMLNSSYPSTLEEQIAEKAKQVAQSFKNMWQSLTDSVQHCFDALRALFSDDVGEIELTPQQEQELLENLKEKYRMHQDYDNEVYSNVF